MIKIEELMPYLEEKKITTAAICDENLYGVMEFYNACQKNNIKPIIGLELSISNKKIYCYPKNKNGYQNLLKIHTIKETREISINDFNLYHRDIKVILPFQNKELYEELKDIFEVWIGYQSYYEKNESLLITENIVYVKNILALTKEDSKYLDYLKMIEQGITKKEMPSGNYEKNYFTFDDIEPDDVESTILFSKDISITFEKNNCYIPIYDSSKNSYEYLVALAKKGLQKRLNGNWKEEYTNRLKYELEVIQKMNFADYFLIVYDYVLFAKKNGILVGPGRGSAAGSLVSYSLGITDIDPLKYHLLFERFLNPERVTMPDIDIDFEYTKRYQVINYVKEKYGKENVAGIMTFGTLTSKLVLRDVAKCLKMDTNIINQFVGLIDAKKSLKENKENPSVAFYLNGNSEIKQWYKISEKLEGLKRHISTHAAGVVISSVALDEVIPICYSGSEMLTGVTMAYLEDLGLLKMDFLALRNLTIIQNVLDLIEKDTKTKIHLNEINLDDKLVINLFKKANTIGIFQFESRGMVNFLEKLKANSFDDLVAALALFRPGPMENIDSFIRRKEGKEKIDYLHPNLEGILKETYGIIVYQEQIMQILSLVGGFSFQESDMIRRAMSKKNKEIIENYRNEFIKGAIKNDYEKELAEKIYGLILKFSNYGFNKAHSVSYALIGYQMAYLRVNYSKYYIANLLNMSMNDTNKTSEYLMEAKKEDYFIMPPDINKSTKEYQISGNSFILPLTIIKNLGSESTEKIIEERKKNGLYSDYFDFVARTYGKSVNKKTIECLIDAGAFLCFEKSYATLKENLDSAINYATLVSDLDSTLLKDSELVIKPSLKRVEEKEIDERKREYDTFGFYISNHPSSKYQDQSILKLKDLTKKFDQFVKCIVVIESIRKIETKRKEPMAFLKCSDETASADFVIFNKVYPLLNKIAKNDIVLIEGRVTKRFDKYQINITNLIKQ